jgi:hypothetical protein
MYRNCIFCSADLKANDALERFPVGRSIAFDAEKGRLWAVCARCARWNLAPIEERWEAIEDAERIFRDTRARAQSENIGLARLPDGTGLVRVGKAPEGELALWRYGESLARRRQRHLMVAGGVAAVAGGIAIAGLAFTAVSLGALWHAASTARGVWKATRDRREIYPVQVRGTRVPVRMSDLAEATLQAGAAGLELLIPGMKNVPRARRLSMGATPPVVLAGDAARTALGRAMPGINWRGGSPEEVQSALSAIRGAGTAEELLMQLARRRILLTGARPIPEEKRWIATTAEQIEQNPNPVTSLALEMALHEETERRALMGELAALEEMWRQAEEIAAIADRLPDELGASTPPRL